MSFSFRDRPSLRERLRGKSGDEIIKELRQELNQDRKMFFDTPNWDTSQAGSTFPRRFPFDDEEDEMMRGGRCNLQAHLDDLAQRHPEFAEQLRPWTRGENITKGTTAEPPDDYRRQPEPKQEPDKEVEEKRGGAKDKLRNTVPDMQQAQGSQEDMADDRGQRSRSAPPSAPEQQQQQQPFVSRIEINTGNQQEPAHRQPTVRHIPIYVEGRDEPILPKDAVDSAVPPQHHHEAASFPQRPNVIIPPPPQYQQYKQDECSRGAEQGAAGLPVTPPPPADAEEEESAARADAPPPPPPQPFVPLDPISRVEAIQKEVEALKDKVEAFQGCSRTDKEYVYLDEMLTRNLLKLDDIETEGKEDVRAARKQAIRSIQRCISVLDAKAQQQAQNKQEQPPTPS